MLPFHDEPVIHENIIVKTLLASCSAKISYRENFCTYGNGRHNAKDMIAMIHLTFDTPFCDRTRVFGNICL